MADDNAVLDAAQRRWETQVLNPALAKGARPATIPPAGNRSDAAERRAPIYTPLDDTGRDYLSQVGFPGEYPYTRGIQPSMYRGRLWTMSSNTARGICYVGIS